MSTMPRGERTSDSLVADRRNRKHDDNNGKEVDRGGMAVAVAFSIISLSFYSLGDVDDA